MIEYKNLHIKRDEIILAKIAISSMHRLAKYTQEIGEMNGMTISEKIFELLKERGMTQKEFSEATGIVFLA
jgi:hypothetical protein